MPPGHLLGIVGGRTAPAKRASRSVLCQFQYTRTAKNPGTDAINRAFCSHPGRGIFASRYLLAIERRSDRTTVGPSNRGKLPRRNTTPGGSAMVVGSWGLRWTLTFYTTTSISLWIALDSCPERNNRCGRVPRCGQCNDPEMSPRKIRLDFVRAEFKRNALKHLE